MDEKELEQTPKTVVENKTEKLSIKELEAEKLRMELETKRLELEAKQLEVLERKANLQDAQERIEQRQLKREDAMLKRITNGQTLKQLAATDASYQGRCNHRKGGDGAAGVIGGKGQDPQYAVMMHKFANGDIWVRCLRCGKTWKPPIRKRHTSQESYDLAMERYKMALEFPTRNQPSGGVVFQYSDGGEYFREIMENVTLR